MRKRGTLTFFDGASKVLAKYKRPVDSAIYPLGNFIPGVSSLFHCFIAAITKNSRSKLRMLPDG